MPVRGEAVREDVPRRGQCARRARLARRQAGQIRRPHGMNENQKFLTERQIVHEIPGRPADRRVPPVRDEDGTAAVPDRVFKGW
ncbi:MAG: hypothetical protein M5R36_07590 [Deltaproteobacteria bacterium]|nr:hypothetical protein [Deltaproteobacteria bacterium]